MKKVINIQTNQTVGYYLKENAPGELILHNGSFMTTFVFTMDKNHKLVAVQL